MIEQDKKKMQSQGCFSHKKIQVRLRKKGKHGMCL